MSGKERIHYANFCRKSNGIFPTGIFGITSGGGSLISIGLRPKLAVLFQQTVQCRFFQFFTYAENSEKE